MSNDKVFRVLGAPKIIPANGNVIPWTFIIYLIDNANSNGNQRDGNVLSTVSFRLLYFSTLVFSHCSKDIVPTSLLSLAISSSIFAVSLELFTFLSHDA